MNSSEYITFVSEIGVEALKTELRELQDRLSLVEALIRLKSESTVRQTEETDQTLTTPIVGETMISDNDLKYGLLRFSSSSPIAQALRKGTHVNLEFNGESFTCSIPKLDKYPAQKGRINGMNKIYSRFKEFVSGRTISVEFNCMSNTIKILEVK